MSLNSFSSESLAASRSLGYVQERIEGNLSTKTDKVLVAFSDLLGELKQVNDASKDTPVGKNIQKEFAEASNNIIAAQTLLLGHYEKMRTIVSTNEMSA